MNHVPAMTVAPEIDALKGSFLPFLVDCNAGLWPIDLMSNPRQDINKELNILRIQASVII